MSDCGFYFNVKDATFVWGCVSVAVFCLWWAAWRQIFISGTEAFYHVIGSEAALSVQHQWSLCVNVKRLKSCRFWGTLKLSNCGTRSIHAHLWETALHFIIDFSASLSLSWTQRTRVFFIFLMWEMTISVILFYERVKFTIWVTDPTRLSGMGQLFTSIMRNCK